MTQTSTCVQRISLKDEAALTRYFVHWQQRFQRSTHGAMVERLIRDSMGSARCGVCHGSGILEDEKSVMRHRGTGKTTERRRRWAVVEERKQVDCGPRGYQRGGPVVIEEQVDEWHAVGIGSECQRCRGTGWVPRKRPGSECTSCRRRDTRHELPDGRVVVEREAKYDWLERRRHCSECHGTGRAEVTVQQTCSAHEGGGVEVSLEILEDFARTNRRLRRLAGSRVVLELYYGPRGHSWADQPGGRMLALQAYTEAGQRLLKRTRADGDEATEAGPEERFASQLALQQASPEQWRRRLLDECEREAARLYQDAVLAWLGTDDAHATETTLEGLLDAVDATGGAYEEWLNRNPDCWATSEVAG